MRLPFRWFPAKEVVRVEEEEDWGEKAQMGKVPPRSPGELESRLGSRFCD